MSKNIFDLFDDETGALLKNNVEETKKIEKIFNQIKSELNKVSISDSFAGSLLDIIELEIVFLDDTDNPRFKMFVYGKCKDEVEKTCEETINKFIADKHYGFYKYVDQLEMMLPIIIKENLNKLSEQCEFWCARAYKAKTFMGDMDQYLIYMLKFNKEILDKEIVFGNKRHPFIDAMRMEWEREFGNFMKLNRKINYSELFRKASTSNHFLYQYQDQMNALSSIRYENRNNLGSIVSVCACKDDKDDLVNLNYNISYKLKEPVKIIPENHKIIRKLLEVTNEKESLLINKNGEAFAIGSLTNKPNRKYCRINFKNYLSWDYYENGKLYLSFKNMSPIIPENTSGLRQKDKSLLDKTFSKGKKRVMQDIIESAIKQKNGTIVVFMEQAKKEVQRLKNSSIVISPVRLNDEQIERATSIDGAIIFDDKGRCYAIGTILDGEISDDMDMSRGARYNSAVRYMNMQKNRGNRTFIAIISEDGYVDCISSSI